MTTTESSVNLKIVGDIPAAFSESDLMQFKCIVIHGGQVDENKLACRIKKAKFLVFLWNGDELIGCAAIKAPALSYRKKIFTNSKLSSEYSAQFPFELGWIVVRYGYRGCGYARCLISAAMNSHEASKGLFATTYNPRINEHLTTFGFQKEGSSYPSIKNKQEQLSVYLRHSVLK